MEVPFAVTYGVDDRTKRERIRECAAASMPTLPPGRHVWAFRIYVHKTGDRPFDVDNVPKLIVDSFCGERVRRDSSNFANVAVYEHDTVDHVVMVQVAGERCSSKDSTTIEIFRVVRTHTYPDVGAS